MKTFVRESLGYGVASLVALATDIGILWILVHFLAWGYLAAATTSFLCGAGVAYLLSVKLAFQQHRLRDRRMEFLGFLAIGSAGLAVNAGVISIAVSIFGMHYIIAKCVAAGFTFSCNFLARRQLLFVRRAPV